MFKWVKRLFGLDYNDSSTFAARDYTRPAVEDKGTINVPVTGETRPAVEDKGTLPAVKKAPKKKAAPKKAVKK